MALIPSTPLTLTLLTLTLTLISGQSNEAQDYLSAHNAARAAVGVPPLRWSDSLAKRASLTARFQRNNKACAFANLTAADSYGANQLWSGGAASSQPPRAAVEKWVDEGKFYNHKDNSCADGHQCGVYTQVVWRNTSELGCGSATCRKEKATLTICFYYPPGNYVGESPY